MDSLTINLQSALASVNRTLNGPFKWIPDATSFYDDNLYILAGSVLLYLPLIFGIKAFMKNREAFDLRWALVPWNIGLAVFSAMGFYYTVPEIFHNLRTRPFSEVICDPSCYALPSARWIFFFNVSKFFEFGDTLFIVLRKKPLIFLHWYHHVMTCLYCWYANQISVSENCTGWPFAVMNLFVHTLMYSHYALTALGVRANWNIMLTSLQLGQMILGIYVVATAGLFCANRDQFIYGTYFALIMYFSYAVLFANFFFQRYCGKKKAPTGKVTSPSVRAKKDQ
jgi:elongation of very long chain fatty acids protein 6